MNSVELTSNCPHEENEKLNDKCSLKAAISDCVQYKTQLSTRFIISNGELFGKQLHSLRHPRTGRGAIYAIGNERIEELLKFDDGFRSILFGNNVISNGSLSFLVPVNPVLLLLPYLRKYAQDSHVPLREILVDNDFPAIKLLENVKNVKSSLRSACDWKNLSGVETYKYSESLLINHIINGIKKMGNLGFSDKQSFDSIVRGILEEYLPGDILNLINANYMLCDKTVPSKKRRNSNFKNKDDEGEITGDVFKKIQTVDSCTNSVPHKIPRLRENKTLTH